MSKELKKIPEVKVFGMWPTAGIEAEDPGLKRYISARLLVAPKIVGETVFFLSDFSGVPARYKTRHLQRT